MTKYTFEEAKKIICTDKPRETWWDALSGVDAIVAVLRNFPETEKEAETLHESYYGFEGRCYFEDLMDYDIYDPSDLEYGLERFQEGWRLFCTEAVNHAAQLKVVGFEFPHSVVDAGLKFKVESEAAAKAYAESHNINNK